MKIKLIIKLQYSIFQKIKLKKIGGNITIMDEEKSGSVYAHVSDYAFNENSSFFLNAGAKCDVQYENGSFNGFTVEPFLSGTIHIDLK